MGLACAWNQMYEALMLKIFDFLLKKQTSAPLSFRSCLNGCQLLTCHAQLLHEALRILHFCSPGNLQSLHAKPDMTLRTYSASSVHACTRKWSFPTLKNQEAWKSYRRRRDKPPCLEACCTQWTPLQGVLEDRIQQKPVLSWKLTGEGWHHNKAKWRMQSCIEIVTYLDGFCLP